MKCNQCKYYSQSRGYCSKNLLYTPRYAWCDNGEWRKDYV